MREAHHPSHEGAFASQNGPVLHAKDVALLESLSSHSARHDVGPHDNQFVVDDAHLLFSGKFSKSGNDLLISADGRDVTVHDYFRGEARAPLYAPDGSSLSGQVVSALAGHASYAQAGDAAATADTAIGKVAKLTGTATAVRNGVSVELHIGDKVYKGDVVEAGAGASLGITFVDGTAFSLGSNARMVLNDMVYDPNGSSNSSFLSLVQGSITFVAGQTAKNGSMKIDTPVATMGIRGTAVFVDIAADNGPTKFSVLVEPGNHVGSYELFDKATGDKIGEVSTAGINVIVSYTGFKQLSITQEAKTLLDLQAEQNLIQQVFSMAFEKVNDANPKFNFGSIGSGVSPFGGEYFYPFNPQSPPVIKLTSLGAGSDDGKTLTVAFSIPNDPPPIVKVSNVSTVQAGGVTNVVVTQSSKPGVTGFAIADQVKVIDPSVGTPPFFDVAVNYVKGTAFLLSAVGPASLSSPLSTAVPSNFLASLISIDPTTGAVSYDPSKFQFLGQGESAVFTIQFDSYGGPTGHNEANFFPYTVVETITLTVLGLNDAPVFNGNGTSQYAASYAAAIGGATSAQALGTGTDGSLPVVTASLTERPGLTGSAALDTATIQLPFTDQDYSDVAKNYTVKLLQASASGVTTGLPHDPAALATELKSFLSYQGLTKALNSIDGNITEVFSAPDGAFDYLAAGEKLTISYTIQVTDPHGATGTEVVDIVVTGTNDRPVLATTAVTVPSLGQVPAAKGGGSWLIANGTDTFTDVDLSDHHTVTATFDAARSELGALSGAVGTIAGALVHDSTGGVIGEISWTFTLSAADLATVYNASLIAPGTNITEVFDITVNDGHGGTATELVTIDIATGDVWTGAGGDGLWSDPANWTTGVPGPISNVTIAPSAPTTVTITADDTIYGLSTSANTTLDIVAGTLTIAGPASNTISGPVTNGGEIAVDSNLTIDGAVVTDTSSSAGFSVGSGHTLVLENGAVVSGGTLTNAGTVHVETSTGATLDGVNVDNTGGTVQVDVSEVAATLLLDDGTTITGGKLSLGNSGEVEIGTGDAGLTGVTVLNGTGDVPTGEILVDSGAILTLTDSSVTGGTIVNDGTLAVSGTLTLSGVTVSGGAIDDFVTVSGSIIAGDIDIFGSSKIDGNASLNDGGVTVEAKQTLTLDDVTVDGTRFTDTAGGAALAVDGGHALTLQDGAVVQGGGLTNAGTVYVEAPAGATLDGVNVDNTGGTVQIDVSEVAATLLLDDGATITGGKLSLGNSGEVEIGTGDAGLIEVTVLNGIGEVPTGEILIDSGAILTLTDSSVTGGTIVNDGTLAVSGTLTLSGVTITGGAIDDFTMVSGSIIAGDIDVIGSSKIDGNASLNGGGVTVEAKQTLTLDDVTVDGTRFTDTAGGAALAVDGGHALTLQDGAVVHGGGLTNAGTVYVEAPAGATLDGVNVDNTGGTVQVDVSEVAATLLLDDGTTITSGKLSLGNSGEVEIGTGGAGLTGVTVLNGTGEVPTGEILIDSGAILTLTDSSVTGGTIVNDGTATVSGTLTLSGVTITGGAIDDFTTVSGNIIAGDIDVIGSSKIDGNASLSGGGVTIEAKQTLTLDDVTVDGTRFTDTAGGALAVDSGHALTLRDGAVVHGGGLTNAGTVYVEAPAGATLDGVNVDNTGGTVQVDVSEVDSTLLLDDGTTITSGKLSLGNSGEVKIGTGGAGLTEVTVLNGTGDVPTGEILIDNGAALTLNGVTVEGGSVVNNGELVVASGLDDVTGSLSGGGTDTIEGLATLEVNTATGQTVDFVGAGGTFQVDGSVSGGAIAGITAIATGSASLAITGSGDVSSTARDAIDATSADGAVSIELSGTITGALGGIAATENGSGDITITADGPVVGQGGDGIVATESATATGNILVNGTGDVTGTGDAASGIVAVAKDAAGSSNVEILQTGNVTGGYDGIQAGTFGSGNVTVTTGDGATITGSSHDAIDVHSAGSGSIAVKTAAGTTLSSVDGSSAILAINVAPSIASAAHSEIIVTATGTINSGSGLTDDGLPPAGILAGYIGGTKDPSIFPVADLNGSVIVNSTANITAAAGDGIRAFDYGTGLVDVYDTGGLIKVLGGSPIENGFGNGIAADNFGGGSIAVVSGDIDSSAGGSGVYAVNFSPVASSASYVHVTAYGTILSGAVPTHEGDPAAGILAGYNFDNLADNGVSGSVMVDDFASITAAAGTDGIRAFNFGTGTVTVTVEKGAVVDGGLVGVAALGKNGGDVFVTNHGEVTGADAVVATTTGLGTASIDNFGELHGDVHTSHGSTFTNELGAEWSLDGANKFGGSSTLLNDGQIDSNGVSSIDGVASFTNNGAMEVHSGHLSIGSNVLGTGSLLVDAGSELELGGADAQAIHFNGVGTLKFDQPANVSAAISGLATGDVIDLAGVVVTSLNFDGTALTINGQQTSFSLTDVPAGDTVTSHADGSGGTDLVIAPGHVGPAIETDKFTVGSNDGATIISNIYVKDVDPGAATELFSFTTQTAGSAVGTGVAPACASGVSLAELNTELGTGLTYTPGATPPNQETLTLTVTDCYGHSAAVNFVFSTATPPPSTGANLVGTSGNDVIFGTDNGDVLTGGGGFDQFVFEPHLNNNFTTNDTITDFNVNQDKIDLRAFANISSFSDIQAAIHQQGSDTLIQLDSQDKLHLKNVTASSLHASDFILHA